MLPTIKPFCYVCPRDWALFQMLVRSWERIGRQETWTAFFDRLEPLTIDQLEFCISHNVKARMRRDRFHPWCGWEHAMSKFHGWADMVNDPMLHENDYCLYVDSDGVFFTDEILGEIPKADFTGFPHDHTKRVESLDREWSWLSGCFQAGRVGKVREMVNMTTKQLDEARAEMLRYDFPHNEDVVISFLMAKVGAAENRLRGALFMEPDYEAAFRGKPGRKSFMHLNGHPVEFLGVRVKGKWDIPMALAKAGVNW